MIRSERGQIHKIAFAPRPEYGWMRIEAGAFVPVEPSDDSAQLDPIRGSHLFPGGKYGIRRDVLRVDARHFPFQLVPGRRSIRGADGCMGQG